ncbi:MAG TPA: GAF domain-containing protein [Pyrinomonadaceae bacterium]|nr:GAF domain-containing protein [Pyrinomonadaceae bacterium]
MNEPAADNLEAPLSDLYQINRIIADTASDAIITIDEESTMLFVNRAAEKIFGYSRAELLGQSLTMLMPDYLRHVHRAGLQRYLATGQRHISWEAVQLPGRHQSGREIPLELSFGEFTENGRRFFTGIARDITERRRLERRLDAQLQVSRILAASDSMADAAPALLQAIGESVGWEMGQMWGVDRAADVLRYLAVWRVASVPAADLEEASRTRTFSRGIGLPGRIWAAGTSEWITDIASDTNFPRGPFATKAGLRSAFGLPIMVDQEVSGVMEFFSRDQQTPDQSLLAIMNIIGQQIGDFVERKRAEEERARTYDREQRARLEIETAIDRMKQVQTVTDVALAHLSMDELLAELLTRVREAMNVDTVAILLLEPEGDELVAWAAKGLEEEVELGVRIPVGVGFAGKVAATKTPVRIDDLETSDILNPLLRQKGIRSLLGVPLLVEGRVIGVIHTGKFTRYEFTDDDTRLLQLVADRIALAIDNARLFEEERTARREAEAASRAKDEFLTTISHELRTPLTPIIGWIHMIRNGILPEKETIHGLSVIEKNSYALKRLINDLLDMSAILSGKMRMEELPVSLEQVLREAVETVRPMAAARNIEIALNFHDGQNEIVSGDRTRLVQVFWNLLHNAVKFSSPEGQVEVDIEANEFETTVRIQDAGQGIAAEFLPFVFERFRQADGSKTRIHGGLGLGLALVKSFVEAHRGTVKAESQGVDQGSRLTVSLPRRQTQVAPVGVDSEKVRPQSPPKSVHLMIVEDDPDTLEMLRATLEARGFHVTSFESAAETLAAAPGTHVDLIISDIGMPEMDGFHMIEKLRQVEGYQDIPAIALSGYASQKDAKAALAAGFDAHVSKPVDPAELVIMVNGLLEKTSATKS